MCRVVVDIYSTDESDDDFSEDEKKSKKLMKAKRLHDSDEVRVSSHLTFQNVSLETFSVTTDYKVDLLYFSLLPFIYS